MRVDEDKQIAHAMEFARTAHDAQMVGYFDDHVMKVYDKVRTYTSCVDIGTAALLHDVVEDTEVGRAEIEQFYGREVEEIVWCLTDEEGINRKERKMKTYWKIRSSGASVLIKLCDRWENVTRSIRTKSKHGDMYAKEYYTFKCALWSPNVCIQLWNELDALHAQLKEKNIWLPKAK
jgi:Guanosine polyphosphate pyrophosphohydrolases/synthetases